MSTIPKGHTDNYTQHVKKINQQGKLVPHPARSIGNNSTLEVKSMDSKTPAKEKYKRTTLDKAKEFVTSRVYDSEGVDQPASYKGERAK